MIGMAIPEYCKRKGHVKTECPALAKKTRLNTIVAPPVQKLRMLT